jgi:hypothetical protein
MFWWLRITRPVIVASAGRQEEQGGEREQEEGGIQGGLSRI